MTHCAAHLANDTFIANNVASVAWQPHVLYNTNSIFLYLTLVSVRHDCIFQLNMTGQERFSYTGKAKATVIIVQCVSHILG